MSNLPVFGSERRFPSGIRTSGKSPRERFGPTDPNLPSLAEDGRYPHVLLEAVARLPPGVVDALPFLRRQRRQSGGDAAASHRRRGRRETHLSLVDAGVDGVQQVGSVLVALGEFASWQCSKAVKTELQALGIGEAAASQD
ncbi:hypothetical protein EYF80_032789 [Liparis tanakae]|uniref:Uncharacterized protein n=1 Tax=Liparis tanakae TaxID=230148 RepID=A0A4Z2GTQ5_9TELE|nr:hypothetical protein EYF80_032789 [Liparis tanakae]